MHTLHGCLLRPLPILGTPQDSRNKTKHIHPMGNSHQMPSLNAGELPLPEDGINISSTREVEINPQLQS